MTLADAQAHLKNAENAYDKALEAQQIQVAGVQGGSRTVQRADLATLGSEIERWRRIVQQMTRKGVRVRRGVTL